MTRWADWFAISPAEENRFLDAAEDGDEAVDGLLIPSLESAGAWPAHFAVDKWWEPIHRCLTGDYQMGGQFDFMAGDYPLAWCVLGGEPLYEGYGLNNRTAALVFAEVVPDVANALAGVDEVWLRQRFFDIPDHQFHEIDERMFVHVWHLLRDRLSPLFASAAAKEWGVICTISH